MNTTIRHAGCLFGHAKRKHIEWMSLFLLLGTTCLVSAYFFTSDRLLAHATETARLQGQTRIIDENLRHQLEGARGALTNLGQAWERGTKFDAAALDAVRNAMPGVRALLIFDAHGRVIASSRAIVFPASAWRALLAQDTDADRLHLMPLPARAGMPDVGIMLALRTSTGALVAAQLDASYFDVVMRSVLYAPDMRTAIFDGSAGALLYSPPGTTASQLEAAFPRRDTRDVMVDSDADSVFRATADSADDERIIVRRRFAPASLNLAAPLSITISRSVDAMNRPWLRLTVVYFSAWLLVATLTVLMLMGVQRRRHVLQQAEVRRFAEQQQHAANIELALAGADLGLWDWHLATGMRMLNERGAAMLGYAQNEPSSIFAFYQLVHPDDADTVNRVLDAHLQGETPSYEAEFRMRHRNDGWLWVHCRGRIVERDAAGTPLRIMGTRMDITERKISEEQIHRLAFYDGLTGLPNRRLLMQRLQYAVGKPDRHGRFSALMFLDLDQFKRLNDTLGHDTGDQLLQSVAQRLREATRCNDTVARLGGDEFVILLDDLACDDREARRIAEIIGDKILRRLEQPHLLKGRQFHTSCSIGATLFSASGQAVETILKQADLAMYQAKADGRAGTRFFDPAMQRRILDSVTLEEDLRLALQQQQLQLHYQPIVDVGGRVRGVEALLRWTHPRRGPVSPDEFIAVAEKTGLILQLGHWVLEQACNLLLRWDGTPDMGERTVAVNVSARQFRQPDFVPKVVAILARTGAPPSKLKLELTESMLLEEIDEVSQKMQTLQDLGITFSLDDFGTGYSSLIYLKKLPLSQLKIDRSFVQDVLLNPNDAAIARTIIALARSLSLEVVAEGVETEAQFDFLTNNGCTLFQGYLFGRPVPLEAD